MIADALKTREPQSFKNSRGKTETVTVKNVAGAYPPDGRTSTMVQVGKDRFIANTDPGVNRRRAVTKLVDLFSQQPRAVRSKTGNFNVKDGPSPYDKASQERLNDPTFTSAANAQHNRVDF